MLEKVLQIIAPHYCYGCQKPGTLLCSSCKTNIEMEPFSGCIVCGTAAVHGICRNCQTSYETAYCSGERSEELRQLIDGLKFSRQRAAAQILAEILAAATPVFPAATVVVPIPTIAPHIRVRGYDHARLLAMKFARQKGLSVQSLLERAAQTVQRGADKKVRRTQAKAAVRCRHRLSEKRTYILVDDVVTTGATLEFAAKTLQEAGARHISVAVVARQPMKKT